MYYFIGGVPTAGKSHLAKEFISDSSLKIEYVKIDILKNNLRIDKELAKWVNFFRDQDENVYWEKTSCTEHMKNFVMQSEALWPHLLTQMNELMNTHEHIIFEGTSLIPKIMRKYTNLNGLYMVPKSLETIYIRLIAHSRWGKTNNLKRQEAKCFFEGNSEYIKVEAKKYGYKIFNDYDLANQELGNFFYK